MVDPPTSARTILARSTMARIFPRPRGRYFTPYLSIGDDIETGLLLRLDREDRRVVLGFGQERIGDAPQLAGTHTRRKAPGQLLAVDQPFGLGIAADQGGRKQHLGDPSVAVLGNWRLRLKDGCVLWAVIKVWAVSYTHLTLPTIYSV